VYDVISQSHAYEFHCCTHIPRLAQMLWLHFVLGPGKMRVTNSMDVFTFPHQSVWHYFYAPNTFIVVYHEKRFFIHYIETKLNLLPYVLMFLHSVHTVLMVHILYSVLLTYYCLHIFHFFCVTLPLGIGPVAVVNHL
jgi:hypothetical protein